MFCEATVVYVIMAPEASSCIVCSLTLLLRELVWCLILSQLKHYLVYEFNRCSTYLFQ